MTPGQHDVKFYLFVICLLVLLFVIWWLIFYLFVTALWETGVHIVVNGAWKS
jgi:hypothetical protein